MIIVWFIFVLFFLYGIIFYSLGFGVYLLINKWLTGKWDWEE